MANFLFWNINKKQISEDISLIVDENNIDIIVLAECEINTSVMLTSLNRHGKKYYQAKNVGCTRLDIYVNFITEYITTVYDTDRLTVRKIHLPASIEILLAAVHFNSKMYLSSDDQTLEAAVLSDDIKKAEKLCGITNTVLVGDLNMNPFENGMVGANALNAVMCKKIASKINRTVSGNEYPFFYNPMWNFFGDMDEASPPGTYYYQGAKQIEFFWNIFDQVLIRPSLIERFDGTRLGIITKNSVNSLLNNHRPAISDHLPITFSINM